MLEPLCWRQQCFCSDGPWVQKSRQPGKKLNLQVLLQCLCWWCCYRLHHSTTSRGPIEGEEEHKSPLEVTWGV